MRIDKAPGEGQHVRCSGEDVSVGDLLIDEGTVLGPRHLGLLASVGRATIAVRGEVGGSPRVDQADTDRRREASRRHEGASAVGETAGGDQADTDGRGEAA